MAHRPDVNVPFGSNEGEVPAKALSAAARLIPFVIAIPIAGGAAANTDFTADKKIRVLDAWAVHTGGAGETSDTIQLFNGANAISDAMDWSGLDTVIVRAAQIDDAYHEVAKAGTLRVTTTDNDSGDDVGAGVVYVLAVPVL
jgi:hypothetical protein